MAWWPEFLIAGQNESGEHSERGKSSAHFVHFPRYDVQLKDCDMRTGHQGRV